MSPDSSRERWDRMYAQQAITGEASSFVRSAVEYLSPGEKEPGTGLFGVDIAGGSGKNAVWLAQRGVAMTVVDVSPVGLKAAETEAHRVGVEIATQVWDLEADGVPPGRWDVIVKTYFLDRDVLVELAAGCDPGEC